MKLYLFIALLITTFAVKAQNNFPVQFTITILDSTQIDTIKKIGPHYKPFFKNNALNAIIHHFPFTKFERAYPASRYRSLRDIWLIETDSIQVMNVLTNVVPGLFLQPKFVQEPYSLYTPAMRPP